MIPDSNARLTTCFRAVFPDLTDASIVQSSMTTLEKWDSLATVMLISVIEEDYQIQIADDDLEKFISFEAIMGILEDMNTAS